MAYGHLDRFSNRSDRQVNFISAGLFPKFILYFAFEKGAHLSKKFFLICLEYLAKDSAGGGTKHRQGAFEARFKPGPSLPAETIQHGRFL